jgi:hypothetical protein
LAQLFDSTLEASQSINHPFHFFNVNLYLGVVDNSFSNIFVGFIELEEKIEIFLARIIFLALEVSRFMDEAIYKALRYCSKL